MNYQHTSPDAFTVPARARIRSSSLASSTHTQLTDVQSTTSTNTGYRFPSAFLEEPFTSPHTFSETSPGGTEADLTSRDDSLTRGDASDEKRRRRTHSKSRKGCQNCKRRRVKCPENRPICSECHKLGIACVWTPNPVQSQSHDPTSTANLPSLECSLLFHWMNRTSRDFYLPVLWAHHVPPLAFEHPHLLHVLFSVTAAHQLSMSIDLTSKLAIPADDYIARHRQQAIEEFRRDLGSGVHTYNAKALFATAILLAFQSFTIDPSSWTRMFKGVRSVAHQLHAVLPDGPDLWNQMVIIDANLYLPIPPTFPLFPIASGPCETPVAHLARLYGAQSVTSNDLFAFLVLLSEQFLDLVARDHQAALVILYYYFLLLHRLEADVWWIGEFGREESMRIWHQLDDRFRAFLPGAAQSVA